METKFRKIGILTSGGDAPGMNCVIKSVTCAAIDKGVEVVGIIGGYSGLINDKIRPLTKNDVAGIVSHGGTFLYSDRCDEFKTEAGMQKAIATCKKHNIDGIVAIGGDGTFRGATDLSIRGIPCIGVTGTIDNDITASDITVGYDTAMNSVLTMGDALRDTCESHARCNVIEVMGRNAGYIAIETGLALGAIGVAVQEIPFDKESLFKRMNEARADGRRSFIVVVAEGLGAAFSEGLVKEIEERTGIETRFVRPAHIVRGGIPTLVDRNLALKSGYKAVELLLKGVSDVVICSRHDQIVPIEIKFALILDRMYKNKLKEDDLEGFTDKQLAEMKAICKERHDYFVDMYEVINGVNR
ncbi:MAG: ATP-dependent 6-phosphofructokinase [Clostridia bacterium]|nr:ATP-dependent 6-phosphofructokinase [Clostridia bacterium]